MSYGSNTLTYMDSELNELLTVPYSKNVALINNTYFIKNYKNHHPNSKFEFTDSDDPHYFVGNNCMLNYSTGKLFKTDDSYKFTINFTRTETGKLLLNDKYYVNNIEQKIRNIFHYSDMFFATSDLGTIFEIFPINCMPPNLY